jgi:LmbE family N-acetylglucosaminyl deacetylase
MKMKVLVIAAHLDDELLGVGGTILKHVAAGDEAIICIVTKGDEDRWDAKQLKEEREQAKKIDRLLGVKRRIYCELPAVKLNTVAAGDLNSKITGVVEDVKPDVIYTHFENDINDDHRLIFNAVMVATRPTKRRIKVACFETLSSTEWNNKPFVPNYYVDITRFVEKKVEAFLQYTYEAKQFPHPRSGEGIRVLAKKRGMDSCVPAAEAFIIVREFW